MTSPIIARLPTGEEYGFEDAASARRLYPEAEIVGHQDGTLIEAVQQYSSGVKPLSKLTRPELDALAIAMNIEPGAHPTVKSLRDAIRSAQEGEAPHEDAPAAELAPVSGGEDA